MAVPSIQEWLKSINPAWFGANTPRYLSSANQLYQNLAGQLYNYDTQEQNLGRTYENNLAEMALGEKRGLEALQNAMANRGTLRSGMTTRGAADIGRQAGLARGNLISGHQADLSQIAANRLNAQSGYNTGLVNLQSQMGSDAMQSMLGNMQQQAQMKLLQGEQSRSNSIYDLQRQIGQAQLSQLQNQNQTYAQQPGQQLPYIPLSQQVPAGTTSAPATVQSTQPVVKPKVTQVKRPLYGKY